MHILNVNEDLEEMRDTLAAKLARPVYIAGADRLSNGTHFKRPRSSKYTTKLGALELYLSTLTTSGLCVKREKVDSNSQNDRFYYDLKESPYLYLVYPTLPEDLKVDRYGKIFRTVGLGSKFNPNDTIFVTHGEKIPEGLQPYVEPKKVRAGGAVKYLGVSFMRSELIATPVKLQEKWHRGLKAGTDEGHTPFVTLQAPGWYNDQPIVTVEQVNRFGMLDTDPGCCTVCRGKSGERRHIAPVQASGGGAYLGGHLCRVCAKEAFAQWAALLDDPKPI